MILDQIAHHAARQGAKTALIHNGQSLSYRAFAQLIEQNRRIFAQQNLPVGSTAVILIQNMAQAWLALLGLRALGLTTICLFRPDPAIRLRNVSCLVTNAQEYNPALAQAHMVPNAQLIVIPMDAYSMQSAARINRFASSATAPNGHICLSTGTTGVPKRLLYAQATEAAAIKALQKHFKVGTDSIYNGLNRALYTSSVYKNFLATWDAGGCAVIDQTPQPFQSCRTGAQHVSVPQAILRGFLRSAPAPVGNADAMYRIGGGLYFDEVVAAKKHLSPLIKNSYASTEIILNPLENWVETQDDVIWLRRTGNNELEIVDGEDRRVPPGHEGFLRIKLHHFDCHEYLDDAESSARVFRDGYFYPGDLAIERNDGRIRILGRASEVIVVKTAKFAVGPIERDLRHALKARVVALFARRNLESEDELVVVIEGDRSPATSEVRAALRDFALFEKVHILCFHTFPATPNGKVNRLALRERAFKQVDQLK
ncbi:MAG: hypothetical protein JWM36_3885 [Hyphomicrobiales bacterium]|nr:hypothetical protein [Hyphomicrobiales bacterium]